MSVEAGHFALVLAFALALIQSTVPLLGARWHDSRMMASAGPVAVAGFMLTLIAFAAKAGRLLHQPQLLLHRSMQSGDRAPRFR